VLVSQQSDEIGLVSGAAIDARRGRGAGILRGRRSAVRRRLAGAGARAAWLRCYNMVNWRRQLGGSKQSGFGREHDRVAIDTDTELKPVCMAM
jgi:acyl-CoA reductase-like NAD-dependent aldehyde dehydrogenase